GLKYANAVTIWRELHPINRSSAGFFLLLRKGIPQNLLAGGPEAGLKGSQAVCPLPASDGPGQPVRLKPSVALQAGRYWPWRAADSLSFPPRPRPQRGRSSAPDRPRCTLDGCHTV